MKKETKTRSESEMLQEYDFGAGVRGKYADRFAAGSNLIFLEPDVAAVFPNSEAVNEALRTLIKREGTNTPPAAGQS